MEKIITTQKNNFSSLDRQKWIKNTLRFTLPLLAMYLVMLTANIQFDGFQLTDFVPNPVVLGGMILYVTNTLYDAIQRYLGPNTYVVKQGEIQ